MSLSRPRRAARIGLTPLIDVVFILLVFFMLASSFLEWRALEIRIPTFGSASSDADEPLRVRVGLDGRGALVLPTTPGSMIARIKLMRTTTAESSKVNGKKGDRLINASKSMSSHA